MTDYAAVLTAEYPGRLWSLHDNNYSTLVMLDDGPKPTKATLDSKWSKVDYDNQYAAVEAQRRARYQTETDGMFFAAQRDGGDLTGWVAAVDAIKASLPYPTL